MRLLLTVLLVLCVGVRLLTPPGFMPSFERWSLTIVPCPDAEGAPLVRASPEMMAMPMDGMAMTMGGMAVPAGGHAHHDDGKGAFHHPVCPYAAAASIAGLDAGVIGFAAIAFMAALPPLARALPRYRRHATRDRPPAQGPPLPA